MYLFLNFFDHHLCSVFLAQQDENIKKNQNYTQISINSTASNPIVDVLFHVEEEEEH